MGVAMGEGGILWALVTCYSCLMRGNHTNIETTVHLAEVTDAHLKSAHWRTGAEQWLTGSYYFIIAAHRRVSRYSRNVL